jgi:hypothetical protein
MPFSLMRRDGDVVVVRERDGKVLGRHKDRKKALRQLRVLYSLEKASFGGDRSAAGRYAAEQRWKNHKKIEKPPSSSTKLTQSEFLDILDTSATGTEVFSRIAERLGKRMKPRLADLSDKEINLYRGVQDVDRDAQTLLSGEIRPLEFATWGQGTYASPDKAEASIYGTLIGLRLDDAAKIVVGEDAWADAKDVMGIKWVGDYKTGGYQSDKIDMKAMKERVLAGKQQGFSGADLYNFWHASQGYDAAFIQDDEMVMFNGEHLTVNRKDVGRAVSKQVLRDIIKASFGGDRSAAGRYAAEQRWKGHVKGAEKPRTRNLREVQLKTNPDEKDFIAEEPKGSSSSPITQRLVAAQSDLNAKGYTTKRYAKGETFNSDEVLQQIVEKLADPKISDRAREGFVMMKAAVSRFENSDYKILITVEKDGKVVGASLLKIPPNSDKAELVYAGSTAEVKGTGSAMFADVIKTVASAEKRLFLQSVDDAYDFWKGMGFNMVGAFGTMGVKKVSEMAKDLL